MSNQHSHAAGKETTETTAEASTVVKVLTKEDFDNMRFQKDKRIRDAATAVTAALAVGGVVLLGVGVKMAYNAYSNRGASKLTPL